VLGLSVFAVVPTVAAQGPVAWPRPAALSDARHDPIATLRWSWESAWVAARPSRIAAVVASWDSAVAARVSSARLDAWRSIAQRLEGDFDESRRLLDRAMRADPSVLDDPDVAITSAFHSARSGDLAAAVERIRGVLARVGSERARSALALEVARWSMLRGPDGLADAESVMRDQLGTAASDPMVRATLALVLMRADRRDEAVAVASGGTLPPAEPAVPDLAADVAHGDGDAAVGVALWLAGRGVEARGPLGRAAVTVAAPWRALVSAWLESARRTPAAHPAEPRRRR